MSLQLSLASESDVPEIASIDAAAMELNGITQAIALALDGVSRTDFFMSYIRSAFPKDSNSFWKVSEVESGDIVSAAWFSYEDGQEQSPPLTTSEADQELSVEPSDQEVHNSSIQTTMQKLFGDWKNFAENNISGRHCTLHYIATHPRHQRRGAASMLLAEGVRRADEAGLDVFLQASTEGLHIYEKFGFEPVRTDRLDLAEFGVDKVEVRTCMKRWPNNNNDNNKRFL